MGKLDGVVLALYGLVVLAIGFWAGRGHTSPEDFFVGRRRVPAWAVLCSLVATELSAATFIGVPHAAYAAGGSWAYLQFAFGSLLARLVLARSLIGLYHRRGDLTVYGLLRDRLGERTHLLAAWFFVVGRVFASGTRLFIAGLAFATVTGLSMEWAIVLAGLLAGGYTLVGGIRAVIWTDTLQGLVFLVAAATALVLVGGQVSGGLGALFQTAGAAGRTRIFHLPPLLLTGTSAGETWSFLGRLWHGLSHGYLAQSQALPVALMGGFFLTLATHGTDQDMVQRLLTTHDGRRGSRALLASGFLNFPLVILFLSVGTALWVYYQSGLMPPPAYSVADEARIFPLFVLHEAPPGLRGLIFAGLFAAAMSSMDSAVNALATTWCVDIRGLGRKPQETLHRARRATALFTLLVVGAALVCVPYNRAATAAAEVGQQPAFSLVELALSAMTIAYGGLLGVFLLALRRGGRGRDRAASLGLVAGGLVGLLLFLQPLYLPTQILSWPWWIPVGALVTYSVGAWGGRGGISSPRSRPGTPHGDG